MQANSRVFIKTYTILHAYTGEHMSIAVTVYDLRTNEYFRDVWGMDYAHEIGAHIHSYSITNGVKYV